MPSEPRLVMLPMKDRTHVAVRVHAAEGPQVLILHGIASHMGWYDALGAALAAEGVGAWIMDRRGFGRSGGTRGHVGSWRAWTSDVAEIAVHVRETTGKPVHALGVSLGGAIALATAVEHPGVLDRIVLSAPGLGAASALPTSRRLSIFVRALFAPRRLRPMPYGIDNLTENPRWLDAMRNDPLRAKEVTSGLLFEVWKLQRFVKREARRIDRPVLAMLGGSDKVVSNRVTVSVLKATSSPHVDVEILAGAPHVIAASVPHDHTLSRVVPFLLGGDPDEPYVERETRLPHLPPEAAPLPPDL